MTLLTLVKTYFKWSVC